jgi:type II secretory pathway component PulJ
MMKNCHSDKSFAGFGGFYAAFSLIETAAALVILALICGGIIAVFDGLTISAANSALRMQAFEVAEENMEQLLASSSVNENVEYGYSERYPAIEWQKTVETFFEPTTNRLWARGICSAGYTDTNGKQQKVELTNWLTDLTQQQVLELMKIKEQQKAQLGADRLLETIEAAAEYAGVDVDTIQQWVDNGMPVTEDGFFIKDYLDLYKKYDGNPPPEQKNPLDKTFLPLLTGPSQPGSTDVPNQPDQQQNPGKEPKKPDVQPKTAEQPQEYAPCGVPMSILEKMSAEEFFAWVKTCPELAL